MDPHQIETKDESEAEHEPNIGAGAEGEVETKSENKSRTQHDPKIGAGADAETESNAQHEPNIEAGVGAGAETESKAQHESNIEARVGAGAKPETESKAQHEPNIEAGVGVGAESGTKSKSHHEANIEAGVGAGAEAETESIAHHEPNIEAGAGAEAGTEYKSKAQHEPNIGARVGAKTETESEAHHEPNIEAGVGAEAGTENKSKAQHEPNIGARVGAKTQTESEAQHEPNIGAGAEAETENESKAQHEPKLEAGAEAETKPEAQHEPNIGAGAEVETENESKPQLESKIEAGAEAETKPEAQHEPKIGAGDGPEIKNKSEAQHEPKIEGEPRAETTTEHESEAQQETKTGAEAETEPENESDSEIEDGAETGSETENESAAEHISETIAGAETGTETEPEGVKVGSIPKRWRILSGETNWKNMLNPPDKDLRRYIIHNGEMAMATYDAFNYEQISQYTGTCRYSKKEFFSKVGLVKGNPFKYKVTKYIYATSNMASVPQSFILKSKVKDSFLKQSNWMGYVAVSTAAGKKALGRRDILVAWRGTLRMAEWMEDFDAALVPAGKLFKGYTGVMVHRGFLSVYTTKNSDTRVGKSSAREQVLTEIKRLMKKYRGEQTSITVAGHSLGAALGTLNAADIVANRVHLLEEEDGSNTWIPVAAFVFACPQTGNRSFKNMVDKLDLLHIMRIRNIRDVVPAVPPEGIGYVGVGEELRMDFLESPYLRPPGDTSSWHDLEVYLHLVAGTRGLVRSYKMQVKRDIALVNKYTNALWNRYLIPPYWKITADKGMVQQADGSYKLGYRPYYLEDEVEVEDDLEDEDEVEEEHENESVL